jgi:DNA-directed RNA polymerase subunit RPC12/RpoP
MIGGKKSMYVCLDCGKIFESPKNYVESHGLDGPPYERWQGCPSCSGAYAEAHECGECGHWITGEYIKTSSGQRICENCYNTMELGDED